MLEICSAFEKTDASPEVTPKAGVKLFATRQGMYYDSFKPLSSQWSMKLINIYVCVMHDMYEIIYDMCNIIYITVCTLE